MKKNFKLILWILLMLPSVVFSQMLTGVVKDATTNETLIGVNILIKGTSEGTVTDVDGQYEIKLTDINNTILSFSYTGYLSIEMDVNGRTEIDVLLKSDAQELDEIVVVGYGTQKKGNLTGAISVVSAEDLKKANSTSVASALQGRTPGVSISATSGSPGATPSIRIRGVGSINNNAQPIVVIDGIVSSTGALNSLNPQDIESVSVLKDAASASIYGARSSNGVILVKTKKGKSGKLKVEYNNQFGFATLPKQLDIMNADEYREFYEKVYASHNATYPNDPRVFPIAYGDEAWANNGSTYTDWQNLITNDYGFKQTHYLSLSGGNEYSTYMVSANYIEEEGVLKTSNNNTYNLRINSEHKFIDGRVRFGENISFSKNDGRKEATNPWLTSAITSPLLPVYNENAKGGYQGPDQIFTGINERTNPLAELELNESHGDGSRFFGNLFAEIDIIEGLKFRTVYGGRFINTRRTRWSPRYELVQRSNPTASLTESSVAIRSWQFDQILSYNKKFGDHNLGLMAGHTAEKLHVNFISASGSDFRWESLQTVSGGNPEFSTSSQSITDKTSESFFGRINYDFQNKYLFSGTIRRDGSSRFGSGNRYGVFPAFSAGWKISEDFLQGEKYNWIDVLKVRFSYGLNGNEPDRDYLFDTRISIYDEHVYTLGENNQAVFGAAPYYNFGSPQLKWESAEMINFGVDLIGFGGKLEIFAEYFVKNQNDLITSLPLQLVYGLSGDATPPLVNLGDIRNAGFEFNVTYKNYDKALKYSISANLTTIKNSVDFLPSSQIFNTRGTNIAKVGHSIGSYFGYVAEGILQTSDFAVDASGNIIQHADGRFEPLVPSQADFMAPGDIKFADLNKDGIITAADKTVIGKVIPDFSYGLNFGLRYKIFDLNILLQGVQNVDLYNNYRSRAGLASGNATAKDENKLRLVQDYWTAQNPVADQTRISLADFNNNNRISTWWIEDASFLRLRNLQIGVTIPNEILTRVGLSSARVYIGGENLLTFTKYSGYDPEISSTDPFGAVDDGNYPVPRFYQAGLSISF